MNQRDLARAVLALPLEQQRDLLLPAYKAIYAAYGVDWDLNTQAFAPDYVGEIRGTRFIPGIPTRWEGREGYLAVHRTFREVLHVLRVEVDDLIPLAGGRIASLMRFVLAAGGGEIDQQILDLHEFRDGELVLQAIWLNRAEGLEDLGLSVSR